MARKNSRKQSSKKRAYFSLEAPEAKAVALLGTFNDWDPNARVLKRNRKGIWKTWMMLAPGTYEYRFLVDGRWQNASDAEEVPNPFGTHNNVQAVV